MKNSATHYITVDGEAVRFKAHYVTLGADEASHLGARTGKAVTFKITIDLQQLGPMYRSALTSKRGLSVGAGGALKVRLVDE